MSAPGPAGTAVGVDVGGTKVLGVVISADGEVGAEYRVPTPGGADALVAAVAEVVRELEAESGPQAPVGVGAPGLVDRSGTVRFAPNLARVDGLDLPERVRAEVGATRLVVADNDANCAAWAETCLGAARGAAHALTVTLGTGIGGGIVAGGVLMRGAAGFAGEIGHMVIDPSGPLCPCGRTGCWERYASGSGLGRLAREAAHAGRSSRLVALAGGDPESVRGEHVMVAAAEGDPGAREVLDRFAWWLAAGLANLADVLDPEVIVIGGGLIEAGELLMAPTRAEFLALVEGGSVRPGIRVVAATMGERAGAVGAALLALEAARGMTGE